VQHYDKADISIGVKYLVLSNAMFALIRIKIKME